jgi:hypothetical protein
MAADRRILFDGSLCAERYPFLCITAGIVRMVFAASIRVVSIFVVSIFVVLIFVVLICGICGHAPLDALSISSSTPVNTEKNKVTILCDAAPGALGEA